LPVLLAVLLSVFRGHAGAFGEPAQEVLDVDHADGIVEGLAVDRQPGMVGLHEAAQQFVDAGVLVDRHDLGARHHHVLDPEVDELEQVAHHRAGFRRGGEARLASLPLAPASSVSSPRPNRPLSQSVTPPWLSPSGAFRGCPVMRFQALIAGATSGDALSGEGLCGGSLSGDSAASGRADACSASDRASGLEGSSFIFHPVARGRMSRPGAVASP
jgi:hypothetical protein